jgi:hypothetical protein
MNTKFSWKTLVGLILLTVSLVVGKIVNVPWVDTTAIIGIIIGAVTGVWDILKKDKIQGPKGWIFVIGLVAGVTFLATGGNDENTINLIVGAIIIIIDFIFGKLVLNKEKILENTVALEELPEAVPKVEETKGEVITEKTPEVKSNTDAPKETPTEAPKAKKTKKKKSTKKTS